MKAESILCLGRMSWGRRFRVAPATGAPLERAPWDERTNASLGTCARGNHLIHELPGGARARNALGYLGRSCDRQLRFTVCQATGREVAAD
jgi:hypothetical protein